MKRHSIHSGMHSGSCSCTSCVYRSQSKRPSIQHLIQEGSKIDRLYFGKYLPLRERKLLEKLIRTRGVYDDVRNQLLSTSGSSDQTRSDHKMKKRDDDSTEKSSAVVKIVDLVDRGQLGSSNNSKLSSCCSCCSCSSLRKIKKHMDKHPRVHRHHVPPEEIDKYAAEAERRGRKRRKSVTTKISSKVRAVRFKVKSIRSEPCTCTLSLSSVVKQPSKAFMKKVRSKEKATANVQSKVQPQQKVETTEGKALKKKICDCSCRIAMKSIKKIKNIRKSATKSSGTDMGNQRAFKIKKDSVTLFREKMQKKRVLKDWECEPGICVVDECVPEKCLIKIKARGVGEKRRGKYHNRISGTSSERTHPKKVKRTDSRVQASPRSILGPVICECKPVSKSASSMTSFPKPKAPRPVHKVKSVTTDIQVKRPKPHKPPKEKPDTEHYKVNETERVQASPKSNLGPVICECKPTTKSDYSMTDVPKTHGAQSASNMSSRLKPVVVKEKAYKTDRHKGHKVEKPKKATTSMSDISKSKTEIIIKKPITAKQKPQVVIKETVIHEKEHKKGGQAPAKSKLGHVICECKPSTRSTSSMTFTPKPKMETKAKRSITDVSKSRTEIIIKKPITAKQKPQVVVKETVAHEKEDKKGGQVPAKSKLGHVICECKPSTRSTSSMTFTPKSKMETKAKRSGKRIRKHEEGYKEHKPIPKERYEHYETELNEDTKEPGKQAVKISSSFKFEIEFSKKINPAKTDKEIYEHVRVKRAKRNNRLHGTVKPKIKYQHSKIQASRTVPKADQRTTSSQESQISYLRDSTSQVSKHNREILPFPRECDPLMCIPHECDPEDCARILLSRSKARGRSTTSSTGRTRRKSAGSTTSSLRTSSKSKYIQSKSMESFVSRPRELPKRPRREAGDRAEQPRPNKQAVRIGSSFSFNIEFYKENPPLQKTDKTQHLSHEPHREINPKAHHKKNKDAGHGARHQDFRQTSSQSKSSQSIKNIQVGHRLKRCFCTLKLLQKKNPKIQHAVSKRTMAVLRNKDLEKRARMRQTQTKSSGIAYVVPHKKHNKNHSFSSKVTNTVSIPRNSTSTFTSQASYKASSRKMQSSLHKHRKQKTNLSRNDTEFSSDKTEKQAVRIGSNFSFNIEFSKNNLNPESVHEIETTKTFKPDKPIKHENIRMQQKGIKVHKPRVSNATSETNKRVKAKQTHTPAFLQRCFCTLKLFNKNKKPEGTITPKQNKTDFIKNVNKSITTNRADINYHHGRSKHSSYTCDPYECERRNMKLKKKYSKTDDVTSRSTYSETSRTITSSRSRKTKSMYSRGSTYDSRRKGGHNRERNRETTHTNVKPTASNKQAVKIGSNFSFNVEFYKEKPSINDTRYVTRQLSRDKPIKRHAHKHINPQQLKPRVHHRAIHTETKVREKGIYVGSAIKRCFCTLKFHKKGKNERLQEKNKLPNLQTCDVCKSSKTSYPLPNPEVCGCKSIKPSKKLPKQLCECKISKSSHYSPKLQPCDCKSTSSKRISTKSKLSYDLKSYECAPDVCLPQTCDSYDCYKEIKRRKMKPSIKTKATPQLPNPETCDCKKSKTSSKLPNPETCDCKKSKTSSKLPNPETCDCKKSKTSSKLLNPQTCDCKKSETLYQSPSLRPCDCKRTNSKKSKPTYDLKDYECAPDFCVPGKCNPYECYEEIKKRDVKPQIKTKTTSRLPNPQTCDCKKSKTSTKLPNPQTCDCKKSKTSSKLPNPQTCDCKKSKTLSKLPNPQTCDCKKSKTSSKLPNPQTCDCKKSKTSSKWSNPQTCDCKKSETLYYQSPSLRPCDCKKTSAKRSKPNYDLKDYECAPDFCVPGKCNPYECYEEIKRRDVKPEIKTNHHLPNPQTCVCKKSKTSSKLPNPQTCDCKKSKTSSKLPNPQICVCKKSKTSSKLPNPQTCDCKKSKTSHQLSNSRTCECKSTKSSLQQSSLRPCVCKSTSTKRSKLTYDLKDYECAPDYCVPGLCDPYECYKEIKRRDTKRLHDRCTCTENLRGRRRKRKSVVSTTTTEYIRSSKSKSTQYKIVKETPKHDRQYKVVQEEQRPTSSGLPSRQAVRIGSNFSFNIEFYKDGSAPTIQEPAYNIRTPKYSTFSDTTTIKKRRHRGTRDKRPAIRHRLSQASNVIRKEDRASNVGFSLKRCFCTLGLQKKNTVAKKQNRDYRYNPPVAARYLQVVRFDQDKIKKSNCKDLNVTKRQELEYIKDQKLMKSKNSVPYRTVFAEECLQLNLQTGSQAYDENILRQNLTSSSTSTKSKSHVGMLSNESRTTTSSFSEADYQFQNLLNGDIQKMNSFYRSYFALNLQLSNMKNINRKTHPLEANECEPGFCIPYKCDPIECLKRINSRLKHSKSSGTSYPKSKSVSSVTKSQLEKKSKIAEANFKKYKQRPYQKYSSTNRTNSRESSSDSSRQALRVGSEFSFAMQYYKGNKGRIDHDMNTISKKQKPRQAKDVATRNLQSQLRNTDTQINVRSQNKATGISPLLKKCFCTLKLKNSNVNQSTKQKTVSKQVTGNIEKSKTAKKPDKNKKKTKQEKEKATMANKPYGEVILNENKKIMTEKLKPYECERNICIPGECDPRECYKLIQQRLKKFREHGVGTDYLKHKSSSSLAKKNKKSTTRTVQATKPQERISYSKKEYPKTQFQGGTSDPLRKQTVTFGSNFSFNVEFFKDNHSPAFNLCPNNVKGAGDNRKKTRDYGQTGIIKPKTAEARNNVAKIFHSCFCTSKLSKRGSKGVSKTKMKNEPATVKSVSKHTTTNVKSILKPYNCEPEICVINKCSPVVREKLFRKRRLRSKSTKTNRKTEATCVRSAVMDKGTATKGKRISKSFECEPYICIPDNCDPYACMKKLKAQGIILPEMREHASKKSKHSSSSTQKVETRSTSINTDKESILKQCSCGLRLMKSKPPSRNLDDMNCGVCEPKTDSIIKKQADLNTFIKKCLCTLKLAKTGKELTSKKSTERIFDTKKKEKLKKQQPTPTIKSNKKRADEHTDEQDKEMKTLMPYSKKKFNKLESNTKLVEGTTNTLGLYPCLCPSTRCTQEQNIDTKNKSKSKVNKKNKEPLLKKDKLDICHACKEPFIAKLKKKSSYFPKDSFENQVGLCPVCNALATANLNKKQNIKNTLRSCLCRNDPNICPRKNPVRVEFKKKQEGKKCIHFSFGPKKQMKNQSDLYSTCKVQASAKNNKHQDTKKCIHYNFSSNERTGDDSDLCTACKALKNKTYNKKKNEVKSNPSILCPICKALASMKKHKDKYGEKSIPSSTFENEEEGNQSDLCPVCKALASMKRYKNKSGEKSIPSCTSENEEEGNQSDPFPVCKALASMKRYKKKCGEKSIPSSTFENEEERNQSELCSVCKARAGMKKYKKKSRQKSIPSCTFENKAEGDQSDLCPVCKARACLKKNKKKPIPSCTCGYEEVGAQWDICPVCKERVNKKKDDKKSKSLGDKSDLCTAFKSYAREKMNKIKDGNVSKNAQLKTQSDIRPNCKAPANTIKSLKNQKPGTKKSAYSCPCCNQQCANQINKDLKTSKKNKKQVLKNDIQSDLCYHCKYLSDVDKATHLELLNYTEQQLDKCMCCNAKKCNPTPPPCPCPRPSPLANFINILKSKYSFLCRKPKEQKVEIQEEPFLEVYVNRRTMDIMNKNEFLANLGCTGEESPIMKQAQEAREHGKLAPPVMDLLIDKDSANIVNSEEIIKRMIPCVKPNYGNAQYGKSGGFKICGAKCQSVRGAEIPKKPQVKYTKSERTTSSQSHGSNCRCCDCRMKRRRLIYCTRPVQKSGAGDSKSVGKDGKPVRKNGKAIGIDGKAVGKDGKPVGKGGKPVCKDGKPVGKDGKPVGKDGKPVGKDGKPVGKDGKPVGKDGKPIGAKVTLKPRKLKPCICGSVTCKKNWDRLKKHERSIKSVKVKPCVCGTDICKLESQKMPEVLLKAAKKAQRVRDKQLQRIKNEKQYQKERLIRKKLYAKQDAKLFKKRRKQEKRAMKQVKKYEDSTPDCFKAAESVVDIGKFGARALCDIMRSACRVVQHPRDGVYLVKDAAKYPGRTAKEIEKSCEAMGFFATMARIKRRFLSMQMVKDLIKKLESHPITNYAIHIADKNPAQRMKKFKKKRYREPMDFECSLFMASLRKRPCLRVYYTCPWFYPHCLSLLELFKQFTDILLFILAVGVWSPCIFGMEICRAMMCCCLCTG